MDEIDQAQELEQYQRDRAIGDRQDKLRHERERLQLLEEKGIKNTCKYCGEMLFYYDSGFCRNTPDWSCSGEWQKEQDAIKSGRIKKV